MASNVAGLVTVPVQITVTPAAYFNASVLGQKLVQVNTAVVVMCSGFKVATGAPATSISIYCFCVCFVVFVCRFVLSLSVFIVFV